MSQVLTDDRRQSALVGVDAAASVAQAYLEAVVVGDETTARNHVCLCMSETAVGSLAFGDDFGGRETLPVSAPVTFEGECTVGECGPWPSAPLGVAWTAETPSRALLFSTGNTEGEDPHVVVFVAETDHGPKITDTTWGFNYHDFPLGASDMYCREYLELSDSNRRVAVSNVFVWGIPREVTDVEIDSFVPDVDARCAADRNARIQVLLRDQVFSDS